MTKRYGIKFVLELLELTLIYFPEFPCHLRGALYSVVVYKMIDIIRLGRRTAGGGKKPVMNIKSLGPHDEEFLFFIAPRFV